MILRHDSGAKNSARCLWNIKWTQPGPGKPGKPGCLWCLYLAKIQGWSSSESIHAKKCMKCMKYDEIQRNSEGIIKKSSIVQNSEAYVLIMIITHSCARRSCASPVSVESRESERATLTATSEIHPPGHSDHCVSGNVWRQSSLLAEANVQAWRAWEGPTPNYWPG